MKTKLKRIGILSLAKLQAILMAVLGLIIGIFYAIFGAVFGTASNSAIYGAMFGVGAIIFMPILYGIYGFAAGIVIAFLYNTVAGKIGGIELEFEK